MEIDRRLVAELAVAATGLAVFVGAAAFVSGQYAASTDGSSSEPIPPALQPEGGIAMVGVIVLFVLVMAGAGLMMYWLEFDDDEE